MLRIAATVVLCVGVLLASTVRLSGDDFWLQAKIGELIAQSHAIPDTVLFPFTEIASERFNAHEWLMSLAFHYMLVALGEDGMPMVIGALGLGLFAAMSRLSYTRSGGNFGIALLGGFVSILCENYRHVLRPELPTLVLMALLLICLESFRRRPRAAPVLGSGLIVVLWANSHGSFILGPLIIGCFAAGIYLDALVASHFRQWRPERLALQFGGLLLLSLACCLVNPFGGELLAFVFDFSLKSDASKHLTEWLPTFDRRMVGVTGFWIALGVWALLAACVWLGRRRLSAVDALLFLAFSYLAYRAIRFPVYLGMVAAYIIPACLPPGWLRKASEPSWLMGAIVLGLAGTLATAAYGNASNTRLYNEQDRTKFTIPMVRILSDPALQGNVLNTMELGAELIYRSYPRLRPSMDCRVDSYGFEYGNFNRALFSDETLLEEFVQRYDVHYLLMDLHHFERFIQLPGWRKGAWRIYFVDQRAALLQRADVHQGQAAQ